jgi:hypothetical protein
VASTVFQRCRTPSFRHRLAGLAGQVKARVGAAGRPVASPASLLGANRSQDDRCVRRLAGDRASPRLEQEGDKDVVTVPEPCFLSGRDMRCPTANPRDLRHVRSAGNVLPADDHAHCAYQPTARPELPQMGAVLVGLWPCQVPPVPDRPLFPLHFATLRRCKASWEDERGGDDEKQPARATLGYGQQQRSGPAALEVRRSANDCASPSVAAVVRPSSRSPRRTRRG